MPYVPSKKTDGKSTDREVLDVAVEALAKKAAGKITNNLSLIRVYRESFIEVAGLLDQLLHGLKLNSPSEETRLAQAIYEVAKPYGYEGAELGELNYATTRFIQRVPGLKVERGDWKQELRYWMYASTVEALILASLSTARWENGFGGVFEDVKDEYKRRVNTAYEAEQILKSGDCYDTPYYTRLVPVVDDNGKAVGHMEIMLKRSPETLNKDVLSGRLILHTEGGKKSD